MSERKRQFLHNVESVMDLQRLQDERVSRMNNPIDLDEIADLLDHEETIPFDSTDLNDLLGE